MMSEMDDERDFDVDLKRCSKCGRMSLIGIGYSTCINCEET